MNENLYTFLITGGVMMEVERLRFFFSEAGRARRKGQRWNVKINL